jgi:hypothetical protein
MSARSALPVATLAAALSLWCGAARADSAYIVDQLVVGVSAAADGSGEHVGTIHSGDNVEVLERQGDRTHIRLKSGKDGWVRSSYLTPEAPARVQLEERTQQLQQLQHELDQTRSELARARTPAAQPQAAAAPAPIDPPPATAARPLPIVIVVTAIAALLCGFALGWRVLDRRIRKRYGGLRIY